ncbi:MAG: prolipoprotein diacylglyceryl transferase [Patescibacteria group bacterium]|jgi:phosphatidylglycerol:prolipoprotein diacylglycerol transferase
MVFHIYGLLIGLGLFLGLTIAEKTQKRLAKKDKTYADLYLDKSLVWLFGFGLLGARLYHVIDYWEYYRVNIVQTIFVWQGGLGIYGALLGGVIGLWFYVRFHKKTRKQFFQLLNLLATGLPLAQAIGRLGNYFNEELFGLPTKLPWGLYIEPSSRPPGFAQATHFHPLFAYEAILNMGLFAVLWQASKNAKTRNHLFVIYLLGYSTIRFSLDFLRLDSWKIGTLTTAQWMSLGFFLSSFLVLLKMRLASKK